MSVGLDIPELRLPGDTGVSPGARCARHDWNTYRSSGRLIPANLAAWLRQMAAPFLTSLHCRRTGGNYYPSAVAMHSIAGDQVAPPRQTPSRTTGPCYSHLTRT